jgi:hypothetical protein
LADANNKREYAIDMYWKHLQARDRWYMIVPPTVVQMEGFSDVEGRETNYKHLMTDMNKEWLFKKNLIVDKVKPVQHVPQFVQQNSIYSFKPATQNLQKNPIQQGFDLGIKYRNQFDLVNGTMTMTNK